MNTLRERFKQLLATDFVGTPKWQEDALAKFFRQEFLALAEEVEKVFAHGNDEDVVTLIRSKADELV